MKFHNIEIRTQSFCSTFNFEIMERPNLDGSPTFLKNKPKMQFWNGIMHFFMMHTISVKNVFEKKTAILVSKIKLHTCSKLLFVT